MIQCSEISGKTVVRPYQVRFDDDTFRSGLHGMMV